RPPLTRRIRSGRYADERARRAPYVPYLAELQGPPEPSTEAGPNGRFTIATYNVHRWTGVRGGRAFAPEKTFAVIDELEAEVIAPQGELRPFGAPDRLGELAERVGYAVAFACARLHRRGELGNAVLARWPVSAAFAIDLTFGRLEQRSALAAQFRTDEGALTIAATHLALVDRTRTRQVQSLLSHPQLSNGPSVLLGDMNAWRKRGRAARDLDREFLSRHHNAAWPPSYPSVRPTLALDRAYARGAWLVDLHAHDSPAARKGSDHLPICATVLLEPPYYSPSTSGVPEPLPRTTSMRP